MVNWKELKVGDTVHYEMDDIGALNIIRKEKDCAVAYINGIETRITDATAFMFRKAGDKTVIKFPAKRSDGYSALVDHLDLADDLDQVDFIKDTIERFLKKGNITKEERDILQDYAEKTKQRLSE